MAGPILVTGGTGFIGGRLTSVLRSQGEEVRTLSRRSVDSEMSVYGDLADPSSLAGVCNGVETVVHCAGFAHASDNGGGAFAATHRAVNEQGTIALVDIAGRAGVQTFVFLSSVKAIPDPGELCVDEDHLGEPSSVYGKSKRAAEEAVHRTCSSYGMAAVVLRPAMVYGAGDRGNLRRMVRGIREGWFPPLPVTGNHRSLVHVDDLVEAVLACMRRPEAAGRTYIVASRHAPSGAELYDEIRASLGMRPIGWRLPARMLVTAGRVGDHLQKLIRTPLPVSSETVARLIQSEWYSPERIAREVGWEARKPLHVGLRDYLNSGHAAR